MKKIFYPAIIIALVLLFVGTTNAIEVDKSFQESIDVENGMSLQIEHGDGHVTITPWERDVVEIDVTYRYRFTGIGVNEEDYDFNLEVNQRGNTAVIRGVETRPQRQLLTSSNRIEYSYRISAPSYLFLEMHGDDGNITLRNWRNDITLEEDDGRIVLSNIQANSMEISVSDGDMFLTNIRSDLSIQNDDGTLELNSYQGALTIDNNDGDIELSEISGSLTINGDDGDITISESTDLDTEIQTEDGVVNVSQSSGNFTINGDDVRIRLDEVRASRLNINSGDEDIWTYLLPADNMAVNIRTEDGDVEIHLANGVSAEIILETDDGNIEQDLPNLTDIRQGDDWFTGIMNDGNGNIRVDTEDGDIYVQEGL